MTIYNFATSIYCRNIYTFGVTKFKSIPLEYHDVVKQLAIERYSMEEIAEAKNNSWISEEEYQSTIAYFPKEG